MTRARKGWLFARLKRNIGVREKSTSNKRSHCTLEEPLIPSNFRDPAFLRGHIRAILEFYHPHCIDTTYGGYINQLRDDGSIFDRTTKHLVGTCRFIFNYAVGAMLFGEPRYLAAAEHGLDFLQTYHRDPERGGYAWILDLQTVTDPTRHCYGHAFVLLALSTAHQAGIDLEREIGDVFELLETRFWREADGLYVDEISADWQVVSSYRGQNANMHMCEAMLSAFDATGQARFLERALLLAKRVCGDLAAQADGFIWEHYTQGWQIDWNYNKDDPKNLFRTYGFVVGHFTEWSKLLLILERHCPEAWLLPKAKQLFDVALDKSWDEQRGGMTYTFSPEGEVLDTDRYFWVLAETIAAAALLANRTGEHRYWDWYDKLWAWSWDNLVDTERGGWYRILDEHNRRYDALKSPPSKTDYHPLGACYEILRTASLTRSSNIKRQQGE